MFKKKDNIQAVIFVIFFILFTVACILFPARCFSQAEKVSKLMPSNTQLLSQKEDKPQGLATVKTYKYGSTSKKAKILEFYRQLFKNEGYQELIGYSPEKQKAGPHEVYFFAKANALTVLSLTSTRENGLGIYFISLNEPDTKAIRAFDSK
jgi:hypothetical protein